MYLVKAFIMGSLIIGVGYGTRVGADLAELSLTRLVQDTYNPAHFPSDLQSATYQEDMRSINREYLRATAR